MPDLVFCRLRSTDFFFSLGSIRKNWGSESPVGNEFERDIFCRPGLGFRFSVGTIPLEQLEPGKGMLGWDIHSKKRVTRSCE